MIDRGHGVDWDEVEWDEDKNSTNKEKHRISFEMAAHIFDDSDYIENVRF